MNIILTILLIPFRIMEKILFNDYPFYMPYIMEFGFIGAIARLNYVYQWGKDE